MLNTLGMAVTVLAAIFILFGWKKTRERPESTQELLRFKKITQDGIIELPDGLYRLVIEVEPINLTLMSPVEQEATWTTFRELINTVTTSMYFCIQSRHLDLKDYLNYLSSQEKTVESFPKLREYHEKLKSFLEAENTEKSIKDNRHYFILEVNPYESMSGIQVQNEALTNLAAGMQQKKLSREEAQSVAKQELENAAIISQSIFGRMGIQTYRLNYTGVLEAGYAALNRDLAPVARFEDMHYGQMFGFKTHSLTPGLAMEVPTLAEEKEKSASTV